MSEKKTGSEPKRKSDNGDSPLVNGMKPDQGTKKRVNDMRSYVGSRNVVPRKDVETRSADSIGEISGPDVINALHVAGDTIKSAGDLAGAVNNIGVTVGGVAGVAYVVKKGVQKIKGDTNNNTETRGNSDGEKP